MTSAWIGSIGGSLLGVLGGLYGAVAGTLATQGKACSFVLGYHLVLLGTGVVALLGGIVALSVGQPWHVFFPLLLLGVILSAVMAPLWPVVRKRYAEADQRKLEAAQIRGGHDPD